MSNQPPGGFWLPPETYLNEFHKAQMELMKLHEQMLKTHLEMMQTQNKLAKRDMGMNAVFFMLLLLNLFVK